MSAVAVTKKRAWIAVRKRTEQRHERVEAGIGARRKLRASEATDHSAVKCKKSGNGSEPVLAVRLQPY